MPPKSTYIYNGGIYKGYKIRVKNLPVGGKQKVKLQTCMCVFSSVCEFVVFVYLKINIQM